MSDHDGANDQDDLRAAKAIADGGDVDSGNTSRTIRNLKKLSRIGQLFRPSGQASALQPGDTWQHLTIEEIIGEGGFGVVYRAYDAGLNRPVALKVLRRLNALDEQSFLREAQRLAMLRHPNVLTIHGVAEVDGRAGLWTELLSGATLRDHLQSKPSTAAGAILALAHDMASGLAAIHSSGLIHGDIKPENIMIEEGTRPVLMDFGAGQHMESAAPARYGSRTYMAPEVLCGENLTPTADVFSLGRVFTEVANALPAGSSIQRRAFESLTAAMLCDEPTHRPTAAQVADRLRQIESLPFQRLLRWVAAGLIVSLLGGLAASGLSLHAARLAQQKAQREADRSVAVLDTMSDLLQMPRLTESGPAMPLADAMQAFAPRLETALLDQPDARMQLLSTMAITFAALDMPKEARQMFAGAQAAESEYTPDEIERAQLVRAGVRVLTEEGKLDEAYALLQQALTRLEADSPDSTELLADLYLMVVELPDHDVDRDRDSFQALDSPRFAQVVAQPAWETRLETDRATYLFSRGDLEGADTAAQRSIETGLQAFGQQNMYPIVARTMRVQVAIERGAFIEARELLEENLAVIKDWLGNRSRVYRSNANLLALVLDSQGDYSAMLDLLEELIAIHREQTPNDVVNLSSLISNRGNALKNLGRFEEALASYNDAHDAVASLGSASPASLIPQSNSAEALWELGRYAEAQRQAKTVRSASEQTLGAAHPITGHASMIAGAATMALGDPSGESLLHSAVETFRASVGEESPLFLQAQGHLALGFAQLGNKGSARSIVVAYAAKANDALPADHIVNRLFNATRTYP